MCWFRKLSQRLQFAIEGSWYAKLSWFSYLLVPVAVIFQIVARIRRAYLQKFKQKKVSPIVIVVGNITVGGVGKTPLVIALAQRFLAHGLKVGIISRGYKAQASIFPHTVKNTDSAALVGDEALLMALRCECPVVIDPNRARAAAVLNDVDIIISDDGLQHYALHRDLEIAVIDASRGLGNGYCLPAGPLRESARRLQEVDFVVTNGASNLVSKSHKMSLQVKAIYNCKDLQPVACTDLKSPITAITAIGNPGRFQATLQDLGLQTTLQAFPDHYLFRESDINSISGTILMTEKDFVKCRDFAHENMFYVEVDADIDASFWSELAMHPELERLFLTR